ncbi:hypothetical protein [Noviherbaspirillum sp.]|uniref:hypothetical protein n=1 Tax=Noviherbaspirillum sp. TaxID=1926288 RepID=UPI002D6C929A|nr:hypothetical protein [Noviherbaspirillum sp.]HZW20626.1 hypothetical protein [Noviherbaspirillum sp.]
MNRIGNMTLREAGAVFLALALFVAAFVVGYHFGAAWAGRIGSLIIIVGVWFAFSDIPQVLREQAERMSGIRLELEIYSEIDRLEDERHYPLNDEEKAQVRRRVTNEKKKNLQKAAGASAERFVLVEVLIVCIGTFVNGFGEWIVVCMKAGKIGW